MKTSRLGLRAGFCAAAALAAWFTIVDVVRGVPLASPAYMSGLVFSFTTALPATARLLVFTLLLFGIFGLIGMIVNSVLDRLRLRPRWYMGFLVGLVTYALAYAGSLAIYEVDAVRALGRFATIAGNVIAGLTLIGYLKIRSVRD